MTIENAIDVLLKSAQADPDIQLLPWLEREFTLYAMTVTKGNQVRAAKLLGITRATLRKRIERFSKKLVSAGCRCNGRNATARLSNQQAGSLRTPQNPRSFESLLS